MNLRRTLSSIARSISHFARRSSMDERLRAELDFHLEMAMERNLAAGMSPSEARRQALVALGGRQRFVEEAREQYRPRVLDELRQDASYALRTLRGAPVFAAAAILTLALGIGATTAMFSIVDHVVLRPLAYREPDRLMLVRESSPQLEEYPSLPANAGHYLEWKQRCTLCDGMAVLTSVSLTLTGRGDPESVGGARISSSLLPLLGTRPRLGRNFTESDDRAGGARSVIVSDAFWRRSLGADPGAVGRMLTLDGASHEIIGVLPASFRLPNGNGLGALVSRGGSMELFVPLALTEQEIQSPGEFDFAVLARVRPGVRPEQLRAQLDPIQASIAQRRSDGMMLQSAITSLREQVLGSAARGVTLLLGAVAIVLLIVCVNLANLLLARNASRTRESAMRVALGAAPARLLRQGLTEGMVLALLGAALGMLVARWGLTTLMALAPADLPRLDEVRLDARVLLFALGVSVLSAVAFGLLPALRFSRVDPNETLKAGGRTGSAGRQGRRTRATLIAAQAGLSTVLLIGLGLFLSSLVRVLRVEHGFTVEQALAFDVTLPRDRFPTGVQRTIVFEQLLERLRAIPGVTGAAVADVLPLEGESHVNGLSRENDPTPPAQRPLANTRYVSAGYFGTLGVAIRKGRAFTEADRGRAVALLSEHAARALWPGEDPIGRRVIAYDDAPPAEVIGITADVRTTRLENDASLLVYIPIWQRGLASATIVVGTSVPPASVSAAVRGELRAIDPSIPAHRLRTMSDIVTAAVAQRRFALALLGLFAITALALASVGIYGVISHSLAERTAEIGVRMALGARRSDVHRLVLREGLQPVAVGLGAGVVVALLLGRAIAPFLYAVRVTDPATIASVTCVLGLVAAIACYIPAARATALGAAGALRRG